MDLTRNKIAKMSLWDYNSPPWETPVTFETFLFHPIRIPANHSGIFLLLLTPDSPFVCLRFNKESLIISIIAQHMVNGSGVMTDQMQKDRCTMC